jgi:hypothetical protein
MRVIPYYYTTALKIEILTDYLADARSFLEVRIISRKIKRLRRKLGLNASG